VLHVCDGSTPWAVRVRERNSGRGGTSMGWMSMSEFPKLSFFLNENGSTDVAVVGLVV